MERLKKCECRGLKGRGKWLKWLGLWDSTKRLFGRFDRRNLGHRGHRLPGRAS